MGTSSSFPNNSNTSSSFHYVERLADKQAIECLIKMEYITLVEPRQQGKTSLIHHLSEILQGKGFHFAFITLENVNRHSEKEFYASLSKRLIGRVPWLKDIPQTPHNGSSWYEYLEEIAMAAQKANQRLVIALDEVGFMPEPPAAKWPDDFFAAIRSIYTSRPAISYLNNITFILAGAFNPQRLITDKNVSDFNISNVIHLDDFQLGQVLELVDSLNLKISKLAAGGMIYDWTHGQPYLVQWLCKALSSYPEPADLKQVEEAIDCLLREDAIHTYHVYHHLAQNPDLLRHARRIAESTQPIRYEASLPYMYELSHVIGWLGIDEKKNCCIRNRIYAEFWEMFKNHSEQWLLPMENNSMFQPDLNEYERDDKKNRTVVINITGSKIIGLNTGDIGNLNIQDDHSTGEGQLQLERLVDILQKEQSNLIQRMDTQTQDQIVKLRQMIQYEQISSDQTLNTLDAIRRALKAMQTDDLSLSHDIQQSLLSMRSALDCDLSSSSKLELTLPLIPLLLNYKFEVGVTGSAELKKLRAEIVTKWKELTSHIKPSSSG